MEKLQLNRRKMFYCCSSTVLGGKTAKDGKMFFFLSES
jgi:hypothetical protein